MPAKTRASLYVRLSREAGTTNLSREGMVADLRAIVEREGFEEVALHVDNGLSGAVRDRPEFLAWMEDATSGRAEVLLAWHVDRMTREGLNVAALLLDLAEGKDPATGKVVRPPIRLMDSKGLDSKGSDSWRMVFVVQAEAARMERERMRDRNAAATRRLREAGRWSGGVPPYGYRVAPNPDGAGKVLTVDAHEAEGVRRAAELVLSGVSPSDTCRVLSAEGFSPRRADHWTRTSLIRMLTGEGILGRVLVGGKPLRDPETGEIDAPFEPVLDLPTAQALRSRLRPTPTGRRRSKATYLASGLLTCHSCGARLVVGWAANRELRLYRCPTRLKGRVCERPVSIAADKVERYLEKRYLREVGRFMHVERRAVASSAEVALAAAEESHAAALAEIAKGATEQRFSRLQEAEAKRDEAAEAAQTAGPREEWVQTGRTVAEEWEVAPLPVRRRMLETYFAEVEVLPGRSGSRAPLEYRLSVTTVADLQEADGIPWWDLEDGSSLSLASVQRVLGSFHE